VTAADFSDDRLSTLLSRLPRTVCWEGVEADLFGEVLTVYIPAWTTAISMPRRATATTRPMTTG
jgi:hypothetical protein